MNRNLKIHTNEGFSIDLDKDKYDTLKHDESGLKIYKGDRLILDIVDSVLLDYELIK